VRDLEAEGHAEKIGGEIQKKIGRAVNVIGKKSGGELGER
jgi:uncharacterized protein YjbJ (UPF0337 family)